MFCFLCCKEVKTKMNIPYYSESYLGFVSSLDIQETYQICYDSCTSCYVRDFIVCMQIIENYDDLSPQLALVN